MIMLSMYISIATVFSALFIQYSFGIERCYKSDEWITEARNWDITRDIRPIIDPEVGNCSRFQITKCCYIKITAKEDKKKPGNGKRHVSVKFGCGGPIDCRKTTRSRSNQVLTCKTNNCNDRNLNNKDIDRIIDLKPQYDDLKEPIYLLDCLQYKGNPTLTSVLLGSMYHHDSETKYVLKAPRKNGNPVTCKEDVKCCYVKVHIEKRKWYQTRRTDSQSGNKSDHFSWDAGCAYEDEQCTTNLADENPEENGLVLSCKTDYCNTMTKFNRLTKLNGNEMSFVVAATHQKYNLRMPKIDYSIEGSQQKVSKWLDYDEYLNARIVAAPKETTNQPPTLKATVQTYANDGAIDGLRYIAGSQVRGTGSRIFWGLTFVVSLIMGILVFNPIWDSFVDKATLNLQETIEMSEFEFPAITFCNFNMWRRSLVGSHYAPYVYMDRKFRHRHNTSVYGKDVCWAEPFHKTVPNFRQNTTWFDGVISDPHVAGATFGYYYLLLDSTNSYTSVQSCMFKGRKLTDLECYSSFQNRVLSDSRICFTFNPSDSLRQFSMKQIDPSIPGFISSTVPAPLPGIVDYQVKSIGRATAIEFLINVHEYEYCSTGATDGVGLEVQVHSRDVQPLISDLMNNVVKLSPGTDVTLTIEEQHTTRETESAGWCSSNVPLKHYDYLEIYDRDACFTECLTDKIIDKCKCFPIFVPPAAVRDRYNELAMLFENPRRIMEFVASYCFATKNYTSCHDNEITTMSRDKSVISECKHCKIPCFERNYLVGKTESKFPAANNFPIYQDLKYPRVNYTALRLLNKAPDFIATSFVMENIDKRTYGTAEQFKDIQEVRDNLMYLRIHLKSMEVVVHKIKFAIGISELIVKFGGTISLFIGASVLSFVELVFWIVIAVRNGFKTNSK